MTTYAEKLKQTATDSVIATNRKRDEEKKRILKKVMEEVRAASQHAAKSGFLECELRCEDCYELNDVHRHRVVPALQRELAAMGFNTRKVSWRFADDITDHDPEKGRRLVLTLGWDEPLDQGQINDLLNPPQIASEA